MGLGLLFSLLSCESEDRKDVIQESVEIQKEEIAPVIFEPDSLVYNKDKYYNLAFQEISQMLDGKILLDFKRSTFLVEWAYNKGNLDYNVFCQQISQIAKDLKQFVKYKGVEQYKTAGNSALFEFFTKPNSMNQNQVYTYDFDDFYGKKDYNSIFVSKLLNTREGQCRSMPMLYKILAEEIGAESYLALAPNHMYVKHLDEESKWVNIELTNGHFSSDSWIISSMDISAESIRKGVYMKEMTLEESVAFSLLELAFAYEWQKGYDDFALLCANKTLLHFPTCIQAIMHKSNYHRTIGLAYIKKHGKKATPFAKSNHRKYKEAQNQLEQLGYREMSAKKYAKWVRDMEDEKAKRKALVTNN
jgi:hypothetical protein